MTMTGTLPLLGCPHCFENIEGSASENRAREEEVRSLLDAAKVYLAGTLDLLHLVACSLSDSDRRCRTSESFSATRILFSPLDLLHSMILPENGSCDRDQAPSARTRFPGQLAAQSIQVLAEHLDLAESVSFLLRADAISPEAPVEELPRSSCA